VVGGGWSAAGNAILRSNRVAVSDLDAFRFARSRWFGQRRGSVLVTVTGTAPASVPAPVTESVAGPAPVAGPVLVSAPVAGPVTESEGGRPIRFACVHLGLDAEERLAHATALVTRLRAAGFPVVVAGDLNEATGGPSWRVLAAMVTDPAPGARVTFSVTNPRRRIDAVLTGPGIETLEYAQWQPDLDDARRASDHFPVLSVIRPQPARAKSA
jgi:hypothetical protein